MSGYNYYWTVSSTSAQIAEYLVSRGLPLECVPFIANVDGYTLAQVMTLAPSQRSRSPLELFFDDLKHVSLSLASRLAASVVTDFREYSMESLVNAAHDQITANLTKAAPLWLVDPICNGFIPLDEQFTDTSLLSEEVASAVFLYSFLIRYLLEPKLKGTDALKVVPLWTAEVRMACLNYIMFSNRRVLPLTTGVPAGIKIATKTHYLGIPRDVIPQLV